VLLAGCPTGFAAEVRVGPTDYLRPLEDLRPGDTLVLSAGVYPEGLPLKDVKGTAEAPIVIRGPQDQSAVLKANNCCNTVQLTDSSYIEIRNLTLDGAGTNGSFGVDARGVCHHITLENLRIINYGGNQQIVGISTKGPAWNWVIRRNTIIGAGTGMYLGDSDGTEPFVNGLIEYNLVVDTIGYNLQIKHQVGRPTDVGLPTGDSRTVIRHNVWSKQNNGSIGELARPNVLVGHLPLDGIGSIDRYEIYGNFFYQNPTEALFQGEGNIVLHDNLFVNTSGSAVNIQAHNDKPRTVTVYNNTVVAVGTGIKITGSDERFVQRIIGNAVFAGSAITGPNQESNVADAFEAAGTYLSSPTAPIGELDLMPNAGRLSGSELDLSLFDDYLDGVRDFNGTARLGTFRGAYEGEDTNSGWKPELAIKPYVDQGVPLTMSLTPERLGVVAQRLEGRGAVGSAGRTSGSDYVQFGKSSCLTVFPCVLVDKVSVSSDHTENKGKRGRHVEPVEESGWPHGSCGGCDILGSGCGLCG